jgi:hypothetical protein
VFSQLMIEWNVWKFLAHDTVDVKNKDMGGFTHSGNSRIACQVICVASPLARRLPTTLSVFLSPPVSFQHRVSRAARVVRRSPCP